MKVVILAGGLGTRLSEETVVKPKPMVEIGGWPVLWHIMKIYSHYGFNEFVICLGYKGYMIKEYFANYYLHQADVTIDIANNSFEYHKCKTCNENWKVTLVDTGMDTMTGGRIKRISEYIDGTFMLTYGDGVADININDLVGYHNRQGKMVTMTTVKPEGRFGAVEMDDSGTISRFQEKPKGDGSWINGGFFVCEPDVFEYIEGDSTIWERDPMENIAKLGQASAYKHDGFWKPMDTLRDKTELERLWSSGNALWKVW